jgi:NhaC family Na+:H+ antiporter
MNPKPTILQSLLPIFTLFASLLTGALYWGFSNALLICSLLLTAAVAGILAFRNGHGWEEIQKEAGNKLAGALPAIIILLAIGVLVGSWMFSGTIPLMVYYGIEFVSPRDVNGFRYLVGFRGDYGCRLNGDRGGNRRAPRNDSRCDSLGCLFRR